VAALPLTQTSTTWKPSRQAIARRAARRQDLAPPPLLQLTPVPRCVKAKPCGRPSGGLDAGGDPRVCACAAGGGALGCVAGGCGPGGVWSAWRTTGGTAGPVGVWLRGRGAARLAPRGVLAAPGGPSRPSRRAGRRSAAPRAGPPCRPRRAGLHEPGDRDGAARLAPRGVLAALGRRPRARALLLGRRSAAPRAGPPRRPRRVGRSRWRRALARPAGLHELAAPWALRGPAALDPARRAGGAPKSPAPRR